MTSRELFSWKYAWKIRDTFQLSRSPVAFIPTVCQSWLLPVICCNPLGYHSFSQGQQEQPAQLFTAPCSHLSPFRQGHPGTSLAWGPLLLGWQNPAPATFLRSLEAAGEVDAWVSHSPLPCSEAVLSSCPSTSEVDTQSVSVSERTHHAVTLDVPAGCEPEEQVQGKERKRGKVFSLSSSKVTFCLIADLLFTRIACRGNPRFNTSISLMTEKSWDELFSVHILPVVCILSTAKEAS